MNKWIVFFSLVSVAIQCRFPVEKDPMEDVVSLLILQRLLAPSETVCPLRTGDPDPLFGLQWHLRNTNQWPTSNGVTGMDSNVEPLWNAGTTGCGVHISVVDDGVDLQHEDLRENVDFSTGFNIDFTNTLPNQVNGTAACDSNVCHGTAVAGVAASIGPNGVGGRGTAPNARLSGRNLLFGSNLNNANLVTSMSRNISNIHVSNNSWGATDSRGLYDSSLSTSGWRMAIFDGVILGRESRGSLYLWAAGNGANPFGGTLPPILTDFNNGDIQVDNSNYDGQANNPNVMPICAVGNDGLRAMYSERGANLLVCGYSEGNNQVAVTTTDITGTAGYNPNTSRLNTSTALNNNYTNTFNGTSSATPNVAGVIALILQARPNLTWREVRWLLARSARRVDSASSEWVNNGAGIPVNHNFGFGAVDAQRAVTEARNLVPFRSQVSQTSVLGGPLSIATVTTPAFTFTSANESTINMSGTGIGRIETVEVTVSFNGSTNLGDLDLRIKAPGSGAESRLNEPHPCMNDIIWGTTTNFEQVPCNTGVFTWTYSTLRNMDEPADGAWTLRVVDRRNTPIINPGTYTSGPNTINVTNTATHNNPGAQVNSWSLRIRGRAN